MDAVKMNWEDPNKVLKALIGLFRRQTPDEAMSGVTVYDNGQGFNGMDAPFLTSVAAQILAGKGISQKQYDAVNQALRKYVRQIDGMDLNFVSLPITATIYDRAKKSQLDGILAYKDGKLIFAPHVYPTSQIKPLGFVYENSVWVGDYDPAKARKVLEMFPKTEVNSSLTEFEQNNSTVEAAELEDTPLMAFQKESVSFMLHNRKSFLGLSPGLGKTICAIYAAKEAGGKTLIVSPLTLVRNWRNEIKKWVGGETQIWHQSLGISSDWVVTNYNSVLSLWTDYDIKIVESNGKRKKEKVNWQCIVDHDFDNLIIDESILIKNRKSQRTKSIAALSGTFKNVWLLSGNPTSKFYDDMWAQLHVLDPKRFGSYWKFAKEYCHVEQNRWGWAIVANQADAETRLKTDLYNIYFCRTQNQVLNLPDWIVDNFEINMYPDQYKLYQEMEETFRAMLPDGDVIVAPIVLTQLLRLVQFASNPFLVGGPDRGAKWDSIGEMLEYETLPAIIWTTFIATAETLKRKLEKKFRIASLTGSTPEISRQGIVDDFQAGNLDAIIAHPGVGKFGLTLTRARTAIYLERGYSGDDYYQSLHRVRRIGTTESPHVIHLISSRPNGNSAPTVDHAIHKILEYRKNNSMAITSGLIREALGFNNDNV